MFAAVAVFAASGTAQIAIAQSRLPEDIPDFAKGRIEHAQKMRRFKDADHSKQKTPPFIPQFSKDVNESGILATFQTNGKTVTSNNAFFQDLGTNGRTCFTCHQPQEAWSISAKGVQHRFANSRGLDPIFRLVDGAVCPTADVSTLAARRKAYSLLLDKGLIRVGLPIPANAEFEVTAVDDPYGCNTNPETGLTSIPGKAGTMSVFRRPLPTTNIPFLSTIMWDGRDNVSQPFNLEANLKQQGIEAVLVHSQAESAPTDAQLEQMIAFQKGLFTAQIFDRKAKSLLDNNGQGGPVALSLEAPKFFIGVNDPLGLNPKGTPFTCKIFGLYRPWLGGTAPSECDDGVIIFSPTAQTVSFTDGRRGRDDEHSKVSEHRKSVARGEQLFNVTPIQITSVEGLNDDLGVSTLSGFCGTCHDTPNVGNHSTAAPLNIGIADAGADAPPALDISGLPVFTLTCTTGPLAGKVYTVTDPGRALISGRCQDIGRFKGPILRGLAGRAPYFHNGSANTLREAVSFYDQRFKLGFTEQQITDLVNFLNTL